MTWKSRKTDGKHFKEKPAHGIDSSNENKGALTPTLSARPSSDLAEAKEELRRIEPKIDLLHDLLGIGRFQDVMLTSDGHFLGMAFGDIGFNAFLGQPSSAAKERTRQIYQKLSKKSQRAINEFLEGKEIPLSMII